ncbi:MAG: tetratricopeptide repeat protein [Deltaproteobacteria bacterium]|nr:tetratricopeptide repeat protein [Deltaproteobacteria bacterium]
MTACGKWQRFRDPFEATRDTTLKEHVERCDECRASLAQWTAVEAELGQSVEMVDAIPVDDALVLRRVHERIAGRAKRKGRARRLVFAGAAACAAAMALFWAFRGLDEAPLAPQSGRSLALEGELITEPGTRTAPLVPKVGEDIRVPKESRARFRIGRHTLGVAAGASFRVAAADRDRVRVELEGGALACDVDFGQSRGAFEVIAGPISVRVKGTRFLVAREGRHVAVAVDEGRVEVRSAGMGTRPVVSGQGLVAEAGKISAPHPLDSASRERIPALLRAEGKVPTNGPTPRPLEDSADASASPPSEAGGEKPEGSHRNRAGDVPTRTVKNGPSTVSASEGLATWRGWIIAGRLGEAEGALVGHLSRNPSDSAAWALLADCKRKAGRHADAVEAYRRVIALGPADQARLARFKAGILCQDKLGRHAEAVSLLGGYLDSSGPRETLRAEALTRYGRSLAALGRDGEARRALTEVVEKYGANPVAAQAREILARLR